MELRGKGLGPKTIMLLNKLNIFTMEDLVTYYPFRYNSYKPTSLEESVEDTTITINATIETIPRLFFIKRNLNRLSFKALSGNLLIQVTIFNRAFLYKNLEVGKGIMLVGKYDKKKNTFMASEIKLSCLMEPKLEPVYHTVNGLKNSQITNYIKNALDTVKNLEDFIPEEYNTKYQFLPKKEAVEKIHNPKNIGEMKQAKIRLIYEEFFIFMLKINYLKMKNKQKFGIAKDFNEEKVREFISKLPFKLTSNQETAVRDCLTDLKSNKKMNRLIEGDVGSGKTIVATISMYASFLSNYQSALMAPTEILARQHYETIKNLLSKENVNVALLVGNMKKKEHDDIIEKLANGEIDIIIGTHALLSEDVAFKNLGLVITDEQHRFGVMQRGNLQNKGSEPDIIYMSATPIPRTYALTIYQDMDTSLIKTKPEGRKEIKTYVKKEKELKSVLASVLEEIKKGHQIYVVAPSILESDERNVWDVNNLKESFDTAFQNKVKIEVLHGKIKAKEKDEIIERFKDGETKILIATTVIEVGVDVENATTILIFNAEMFGLATLHQLRGRVGRNSYDSYCYLISDYDIERLRVLERSNDGFYISEQDFLLRSAGDLFGTKQSGDMVFKIANLKHDFKILKQAKEDSAKLLEQKNNLDEKYKTVLRSITSID